MNIFEFIRYSLDLPEKFKLKTASGRNVKIVSIIDDDPYPIKGIILDVIPGHHTECAWDKDGRPHNLPYTHGLNLLPYISEINWKRIDESIFKRSDTHRDLDSHIDL